MRSHRMAGAVGLAALGAMVTGCPSDPEPPAVGTAVAHGEALFADPTHAGSSVNAQACASCHQASAGGAGGELLAGAPLAGATRRPSYWGGQEIELLRAVNHCRFHFMLAGDLWSGDEPEARAIYAFLDSLPASDADREAFPFEVARDIAELPGGDPARGGVVYQLACAGCHGLPRSGLGASVPYAPALPDDTLDDHPLGAYTEAQRRLVFVQKVRHGGFLGYGGQMPPFSRAVLSDADLASLLAYLGVN